MLLIFFFLLICIFVYNYLLYVLEKKLLVVYYLLVVGILIFLDGYNESFVVLNYFIYLYMLDFYLVI